MDVLWIIVEALKFILPVYCANAVPVLAGGGLPLDLGKGFIDGKPVFGKNKTVRGFFVGLFVGTSAGLAETVAFGFPLLFGPLVSLGALSGDLLGAFVKRRLGLAPGRLLPVVDQIDFILGALLFSLPLGLTTLSWEVAAMALVITPPIHLLTNYCAYKLELKNNPW